MRKTYCPICKADKRITGYKKDDPRLACGHVLTIRKQMCRDELKQDLYEVMRDTVYELMKEENLTYQQAQKKILTSS